MLSRVILFCGANGNSDGKRGYILSFHCLTQPQRIFSCSMTKRGSVVKVALVDVLCTWLCTCSRSPLSPDCPSQCPNPASPFCTTPLCLTQRRPNQQPSSERGALRLSSVRRRTNNEHCAILPSTSRKVARGPTLITVWCRPNGRGKEKGDRHHGRNSREPSHADGGRSFRDARRKPAYGQAD